MRCHTFRGKRWRIAEAISGDELPMGSMKGYCEGPPSAPDREMLIPVGGVSREDLETIIHEALHACLWDINEDAVDQSAVDLARFLWRLGWRKEE